MNDINSKTFFHVWETMFIYSLGVPDRLDIIQRQKYKTLYKNMADLLPCSVCRNFFLDVLWKKYPMNFDSRKTIFKSIYIWKSMVNKKLGKRNDQFKDVVERYAKFLV